ncbi:ATP-dependent helicase [Candidatus Sumerlaeota bacterium]|nr:ATP-dependent helicase [Candidatus Sumerlaeota bacterium]
MPLPIDSSQDAFCSDPEKALRLLAPAGSGKTSSLLWRCLRHLNDSPEAPPRFLVFTFTRAARLELLDRLRSTPDFQPLATRIEVTTLNSWGFKRLRQKKHNLRLSSSGKDQFFNLNNVLQPIWSSYPEIASVLANPRMRNKATKAIWDLIDRLKSLGFRHDVHTTPKAVEDHMHWLLDVGLEGQVAHVLQSLMELEILKDANAPITPFFENFYRFWMSSCGHLYNSSIITLEDQKYWAHIELDKNLDEGKTARGSNRFDHILVDEFQDINVLDLELLKAIAKANKTDLTIVGDDDQAIFEWRGASPRFILEPEAFLGRPYETHILSVNYRSPANIVRLSQKLIANNKNRVAKTLKAASMTDAPIDVFEVDSVAHASAFVLAEVRQMLDEGQYKRVALIGRKRSQIIPYQIMFASEDIPFYAAEDLQIFLSDAFGEMKELLAIHANAHSGPPVELDPVSKVLKLCDKVKRYPLNKNDREGLHRHLRQCRPKTIYEAATHVQSFTGSLKGNNADGRMAIAFTLALKGLFAAKTVSDAIRAISENFEGLRKDFGKSMEDIFFTDPPFLYLAEYAERYGDDFGAFYQDVDKAIDTLARVPVEGEEEDHGDHSWKLPLHLMTALRAKGKEFDAVILLDVNDGIWPSKLAESEAQLEQERRVFYVAFTRARKRIICLVDRQLLGKAGSASRYLGEMELPIQRLGKRGKAASPGVTSQT